MGLGNIGMPMPCLAPAAGIPSAEKLSAGPAMPGAPGVSMLAARAENMLAASQQKTNKRRRDEARDQKKFTEQIVRRRLHDDVSSFWTSFLVLCLNQVHTQSVRLSH